MSQISNIAKPTRYPTQSELAVLKSDYEDLGFEVVISTPLPELPTSFEVEPRKPIIALCSVCGCKLPDELFSQCRTCGSLHF